MGFCTEEIQISFSNRGSRRDSITRRDHRREGSMDMVGITGTMGIMGTIMDTMAIECEVRRGAEKCSVEVVLGRGTGYPRRL